MIDLVGGPFAVIESDPGVFTSLTRRLGIRGLELIELYDIEPWATDHLSPRGLIFCFMWRKDAHRPTDFNDPAADRVWFANQLSDDACATHAILNVVLNCPGVELGEELRMFKEETERMSPVIRGLAITNSPTIRQAHNSLARPADIRGALNSLTTTSLLAQRAKLKSKSKSTSTDQPPPAKRAKTNGTPSKAKPRPNAQSKGKEKAKAKGDEEEEEGAEETYHFIGYVPAFGKVWELDGLKSGPLEVGELPLSHHPPPQPSSSSQPNPQPKPPQSPTSEWMSTVRPALRLKMSKYGASPTDSGSNIRFSLLAIVDGGYEGASDEFELGKRERVALERRLDACQEGEGWRGMVDPTLLSSAPTIFSSPLPLDGGLVYAPDFGARKQQRNIEILQMSKEELVRAWEECVRSGMRAKVGLEDEIGKGVRANTDHVKRTFDYEPFFKEFVKRAWEEGVLDGLK